MRNLRFIERKTHGIIDYTMGALLIASPWLFGFYKGGAETLFVVLPGIVVIAYSLITNYEFGLTHSLPLGINLLLDLLVGITLICAPGLMGFADTIQTPHILMGIAMVLLSVLSKGRSEEVKRSSDLPKSVQ